jgi:hypothetical protein
MICCLLSVRISWLILNYLSLDDNMFDFDSFRITICTVLYLFASVQWNKYGTIAVLIT